MILNVCATSVLLMLLSAAGCQKNVRPAGGEATLPGVSGKVIQAQNDFAFRIFRTALDHDPATGNKLISPVSIYLDLSMAYNGAAGETAKGMAGALDLDGISTDQLNMANQALIAGLPKADPTVMLDIANSLWYRDQGIQPLESFLKTSQHFYQAKVSGAAFDPATVNQINNWVSSKTHQKISSILDKIDPSDVLYLINAVYFKGAWKKSFDSTQTRDLAFHTGNQQTVQTPFMMREATFNYLENDSMQLIELPYGRGAFSMFILLPSQKTGLDQTIRHLEAPGFASLIGRMDSSKVKLRLPKWKSVYEIDNLKPGLSDLGMGSAFTRQADFSKIVAPPAAVYISKVAHKTYIEVNEKGTEAAAVTSTGFTVTSMPLHPTPVMEVNRPFLYVIRERSSGAILFLGEINNPAETPD